MTDAAIEPIELTVGGFLLRPPRIEEAPEVLRLASDPDVRMWNPAAVRVVITPQW